MFLEFKNLNKLCKPFKGLRIRGKSKKSNSLCVSCHENVLIFYLLAINYRKYYIITSNTTLTLTLKQLFLE